MLREDDTYVLIFNNFEDNETCCCGVSKDISKLYKELIRRTEKYYNDVKLGWYHSNHEIEMFERQDFDICLEHMIEYKPMCIDILFDDTDVDFCNTFCTIEIVKELK